MALQAIQGTHGHLQELIIQNFKAKPGTKVATAPEPAIEEQLWTIAVRWSATARKYRTDDSASPAPGIRAMIKAARAGHALTEADIVRLFSVEGRDLDELIGAADQVRHESVGDTVSYAVNRNINYTNICLYHRGFCAFSKGRGSKDLRGPAYNLGLDEVARRTVEAAAVGATEVCLQGGIHPSFTGHTYLNIVRAVKEAVPWMHVHAFSPSEVRHGASTLGLPLALYLERLRDAGLSKLPGTCSACARGRSAPMASASSCPWATCTWRRRYGAKGGRAVLGRRGE